MLGFVCGKINVRHAQELMLWNRMYMVLKYVQCTTPHSQISLQQT